jgi:hypothetical protein
MPGKIAVGPEEPLNVSYEAVGALDIALTLRFFADCPSWK